MVDKETVGPMISFCESPVAFALRLPPKEEPLGLFRCLFLARFAGEIFPGMLS
jgi:hypothetical protein